MVAIMDKLLLRRDLHRIQEVCFLELNLTANTGFHAQFGVWAIVENSTGDAIWIDGHQPSVPTDGLEGKMSQYLIASVFFDLFEACPIIWVEQFSEIKGRRLWALKHKVAPVRPSKMQTAILICGAAVCGLARCCPERLDHSHLLGTDVRSMRH